MLPRPLSNIAGMVALAMVIHTQEPVQWFRERARAQKARNASAVKPAGTRSEPWALIPKPLLYCTLMTPHATRFPAFPAGSVFSSSAFSCTTTDVPPLAKIEFGAEGSIEIELSVNVASP